MARRGRPKKYTTTVTIEEIDYTMSSTGILTARAHFQPIQQDGHLLQQVPIYDSAGVGSKIKVVGYKAIDTVELVAREPLTHCPFCGAPVTVQLGAYTFCTNVQCREMLKQQLRHMLKVIGVPHLKDVNLTGVFEHMKTPNLYSIFDMEHQEYLGVRWIGDARSRDIIEALNDTVLISMGQFLEMLSIPFMTVPAAEDLEHYYDGNIYKFIDDVYKGYDFSTISIDITTVINQFIHFWFHNRLTSTMRLADCFMFYPAPFYEDEFADSKVCLCGNTQIFKSYSDLCSYVNAIGGKAGNNPHRAYDYYICNYPLFFTGDLKYALDNHLPIMSELEFIQRTRSLLF